MLLHTHIDLQLTRRWPTLRSTIGEFAFPVEAGILCYMLEDIARAPEFKIPGFTCIPAGDYWVKITKSKRFNRLLPLIYNEEYYKAPDGTEYYDLVRFGGVIFTGIRMHPGNEDVDTDGCQLPGMGRQRDHVSQSTIAFNTIFDKMYAMIGETGKLNYRIIHNQAA